MKHLYTQCKKKALESLPPIPSFAELPAYGPLFFFQNMGPFKALFLAVTATSVVSTLLRFLIVYLLGDVISHFSQMDPYVVLVVYLPLWVFAECLAEGFDYFLRRYGESLSTLYGDWVRLRFTETLSSVPSSRLLNVSKERVLFLVNMYVGHVSAFLNDWTWATVSRATKLLIVFFILAMQSWWILLFSVLYVAAFLGFSFRLSRRFAGIAERFTEQQVESGSIFSGSILGLSSIRRLGARLFYREVLRTQFARSWERFDDVREFHAKRWFIQLNLFNLLSIAALVSGILKVQQGVLGLGYLVLIRWAFLELWHILVYIIEYYVSLVQQRADSALVRSELGALFAAGDRNEGLPLNIPADWKALSLREARVSLKSSTLSQEQYSLHIPFFEIHRGERVGIIGESGTGKSTLLLMLLRLVHFEGEYRCDDLDLKSGDMPPDFMSLVSSADPLFRFPLRDALLLGRTVEDDSLQRILHGVAAEGFTGNLAQRVGSADFNLSLGQEQRLRLARGLLQQSAIYLLDEPYTGLDRDTRRRVADFLLEYCRGRSVVLVSHDPEDMEGMDRIYRVRDGKVLLE